MRYRSKRDGAKCSKCTTKTSGQDTTDRSNQNEPCSKDATDSSSSSASTCGTSGVQFSSSNAAAAGAAPGAAAAKDTGNDNRTPMTPLSMAVRPLMAVPGFDGYLMCCRDWPQTKKGTYKTIPCYLSSWSTCCNDILFKKSVILVFKNSNFI